jgi:hypothetical protein
MQELAAILELIGKLAERFGPWLTTLILIGVAYFKYIRKGTVVVLKDMGGGKMKTEGFKSNPGNKNAAENDSYCQFRHLLCGEQFKQDKERLDKHDIRLEKGDQIMSEMAGDIKVLLDRTKHLDPSFTLGKNRALRS